MENSRPWRNVACPCPIRCVRLRWLEHPNLDWNSRSDSALTSDSQFVPRDEASANIHDCWMGVSFDYILSKNWWQNNNTSQKILQNGFLHRLDPTKQTSTAYLCLLLLCTVHSLCYVSKLEGNYLIRWITWKHPGRVSFLSFIVHRVPFLIVLILMLVVKADQTVMNPPDFSTTYGDYQVAASLLILLVSFLGKIQFIISPNYKLCVIWEIHTFLAHFSDVRFSFVCNICFAISSRTIKDNLVFYVSDRLRT